MSSKDIPKTLFVGLESAGLDVLRSHMTKGHMPFMASLASRGCVVRLAAPPAASPSGAWAAMLCGAHPGMTGVLAHGPLDAPGSEHQALFSARDLAVPPLWHIAAAAGLRVGLVNLPFTWPAPPLSGFCIAGADAPRSRRGLTHPPDLADDLYDYEVDLQWSRPLKKRPAHNRADLDEIYSLQSAISRMRYQHARRLIEAHQPDLAMVHFKGLESIQRYFRDRHSRLAGYLEQLDGYVAGLAEASGADLIICASAHGCGPRATRQFNPNTLLLAGGLLALHHGDKRGSLLDNLRRSPRPGWRQVDWDRSRAWASPWGIKLSSQASRQESADLLAAIEQQLRGLTDPQGRQVLSGLWRGSELFPGPCQSMLPDLIYQTNDNYIIGGVVQGPMFQERANPLLCHADASTRHGGMALVCGAGGEALGTDQEMNMTDLAPAILRLMGIGHRPAPDWPPAPRELGSDHVGETLAAMRGVGYLD